MCIYGYVELLPPALTLTLTLTLPTFKDENNDHKKQRSLDRADPLKSRKPEQQMSGPGRGGVIGTTFHHSMMKVMTLTLTLTLTLTTRRS